MKVSEAIDQIKAELHWTDEQVRKHFRTEDLDALWMLANWPCELQIRMDSNGPAFSLEIKNPMLPITNDLMRMGMSPTQASKIAKAQLLQNGIWIGELSESPKFERPSA